MVGDKKLNCNGGNYHPINLCRPLFALENDKNIKHVQSKSLQRVTVNLSAVKSEMAMIVVLLPNSLLLGVIQHSNTKISGDRQPFVSRQSLFLQFIMATKSYVILLNLYGGHRL